MKSIRKIVLPFVVIAVVSMFLTSCMTTKTSVGDYKQQTGKEYTLSLIHI